MTAKDANNKADSGDNLSESSAESEALKDADVARRPKEIGGRDGPDPTRYGDWEKAGRCIDF